MPGLPAGGSPCHPQPPAPCACCCSPKSVVGLASWAESRRESWLDRECPQRQAGLGGSPGAGQGQRGLFGCKVPSGGAGHREHAGGSAQARGRVCAQTSCPQKVTWGGGEGERGRKKKEEKKQRKVLQSFAVSVLRLLSLSRRILLQVVIARLAGIMPRLCPELIHVERVLDERNRWCEREPLRPPIFPPSSDNLVLFGRSLSDPCTGAVTDTALRL